MAGAVIENLITEEDAGTKQIKVRAEVRPGLATAMAAEKELGNKLKESIINKFKALGVTIAEVVFEDAKRTGVDKLFIPKDPVFSRMDPVALQSAVDTLHDDIQTYYGTTTALTGATVDPDLIAADAALRAVPGIGLEKFNVLSIKLENDAKQGVTDAETIFGTTFGGIAPTVSDINRFIVSSGPLHDTVFTVARKAVQLNKFDTLVNVTGGGETRVETLIALDRILKSTLAYLYSVMPYGTDAEKKERAEVVFEAYKLMMEERTRFINKTLNPIPKFDLGSTVLEGILQLSVEERNLDAHIKVSPPVPPVTLATFKGDTLIAIDDYKNKEVDHIKTGSTVLNIEATTGTTPVNVTYDDLYEVATDEIRVAVVNFDAQLGADVVANFGSYAGKPVGYLTNYVKSFANSLDLDPSKVTPGKYSLEKFQTAIELGFYQILTQRVGTTTNIIKMIGVDPRQFQYRLIELHQLIDGLNAGSPSDKAAAAILKRTLAQFMNKVDAEVAGKPTQAEWEDVKKLNKDSKGGIGKTAEREAIASGARMNITELIGGTERLVEAAMLHAAPGSDAEHELRMFTVRLAELADNAPDLERRQSDVKKKMVDRRKHLAERLSTNNDKDFIGFFEGLKMASPFVEHGGAVAHHLNSVRRKEATASMRQIANQEREFSRDLTTLTETRATLARIYTGIQSINEAVAAGQLTRAQAVEAIVGLIMDGQNTAPLETFVNKFADTSAGELMDNYVDTVVESAGNATKAGSVKESTAAAHAKVNQRRKNVGFFRRVFGGAFARVNPL